jgi:hypothetical protein
MLLGGLNLAEQLTGLRASFPAARGRSINAATGRAKG